MIPQNVAIQRSVALKAAVDFWGPATSPGTEDVHESTILKSAEIFEAWLLREIKPLEAKP